MSFNSVNAISGINRYLAENKVTEPDFPTVSVISLEERFKEAISTQAVSNQYTREKIFTALNDPNVTSDPAKLAHWQQQLSMYTLDINLCSTLARKGVAAIETLVKT
nr:type III secretion system inner rod subunit SctI [uncultured Enterobacter sp.]